MHAILASIGTDGDVFPYLGLGAELRSRGHRVTLLSDERFSTVVVEHGFAFQALLTDEEIRSVLSDPDFWHPLKAGLVAARWGAPLIGRQYQLIAEAAHDPDAVLVASPGVLAARLVEEKLGKRAASVILQPGLIPSIAAPPIMAGGLTLPRWVPRPLGRLYWRGVNSAGDLLVGRELNRVRASLGLKPVRQLFEWWSSPQLILGMFPDWYGPPQVDWPPQMKLTGFPMYDGRPDAELSADLAEFCRDGDPPIVFTFGTGMMHAARLFHAAAEACLHLGARGILLTRHEHQIPAPLPSSVRHWRFAPFQQLFPLCAAVVHHGGIGTVARALAARTPQLVLPFAYDQPDNAVRVQKLGAGEWMRGRWATGRRIASSLARLIDPSFRSRCRARSEQFSDGIAPAADLIEDLDRRGGS